MDEEITAAAVGSTEPTDPNAVGPVTTPNQVDLGETVGGAVVQPPDEAPTEESPETPASDEGDLEAELKALTPAQQKQFQRVLTKMRQKDTERLRVSENELAKLNWAKELSRLAASDDLSERAKARTLLAVTLKALGEGEIQADPTAGLAQEAVEELEALSPKTALYLRGQADKLAALEARLEETGKLSKAAVERLSDQALGVEMDTLKSKVTALGLPWDEEAVLTASDSKKIYDMEAAYLSSLGLDGLLKAAKKAAGQSLQTKKAAVLPAGGTAGAGSPAKLKSDRMLDHFEQVKRQMGVTGPIEYKG